MAARSCCRLPAKICHSDMKRLPASLIAFAPLEITQALIESGDFLCVIEKVHPYC
jgi:hypothetical protein